MTKSYKSQRADHLTSGLFRLALRNVGIVFTEAIDGGSSFQEKLCETAGASSFETAMPGKREDGPP